MKYRKIEKIPKESIEQELKKAGLSEKKIKRLFTPVTTEGEYERGNDRGTVEDWLLP